MDPGSRQERDRRNKAFLDSPTGWELLKESMTPGEVDPASYTAIYYAGGHGTLWDFTVDQPLANLAAAIYERGGWIAAVCHGPCALLPIKLSSGVGLLQGRDVTGFSNAEEMLIGLRRAVPFLLEDALAQAGGRYRSGMPFLPHVVVSERIITGQNPQSTARLASTLMEQLSKRTTVAGAS